jgi:hypothetical protein
MYQKTYSLTLLLILLASLNINSYGQVFFSEDFEGSPNATTDLPINWTESGLSSDGIWSTGTSTDASSTYLSFPVPTNGSLFAYTNDDECNCDKSNDRMFLPIQDFTSRSCVKLGFDLYLNGGYGEMGFVMVSIDGGTNWDTLYTAVGNASAWQDDISINLFAYAGEASVLIAFVYNDATNWGFAMAVDDVILSETTADLNALSVAGEYTKIPLSLATAMPLDASFTGTFCEGSITDARVISSVWSFANGFTIPIQSDTSSDNMLASGDTLMISNGSYTPTDTGEYIFRHVISSASSMSLPDANDTIEYAFEVTLNEYARDDSIVTAGLGVNGTGNTALLGSNFTFPQPAIISSVMAGFNALSIGDTTFLYVYDTDVSGTPTTPIDSFEHIVQIASPNVEQIFVPDGLLLEAGTYFFGMSETNSVNNMGLQHTNQIFTPGSGWGRINGGAFARIETLGFPNTALIRPILCGPATISSYSTTYCQNDLVDTLIGLPSGGTFSGPGMTDSIFDPVAAGPGLHVIKYTFTEPMGCATLDSVSILVRDECDLECLLTNLDLMSHPDNASQTYRAANDVTSSAAVMNPPHTDLTYKAGNSITLMSDFQIGLGVIFNAFIESCPPEEAVNTSEQEKVANNHIRTRKIIEQATVKRSLKTSPANFFDHLTKEERARLPKISEVSLPIKTHF